ncbi:hypothetical protein BGZ58_007229 [Dissophora ornata]|nr:hypothetical protein BGZ58_007229 [Dissophora ornata]
MGGWGFEFLTPVARFATILKRCPLLKELRFTYDISEKPCFVGFREWLFDAYPYHANDGTKNWAPAPLRFIEELHGTCPNLRAIDFGMRREFTEKHWSQIVARYGGQLESLSAWDVPNFQPNVFMKLMGEPLSWHANSHIHAPLDGETQPGRCLTRLDISGNSELSSCAWMAFKNLPTLKHFKALDVPLDARDLIGYEWVCKGLETLEISVLIPTQWRPRIGMWKWHESEWVLHDDLVVEDDQVQESHGAKEDNGSESEDGYEEKLSRKRKKVEGVPEMKMDSNETKDKKKDSSEKKDRRKKMLKEKKRGRSHDAKDTESPRGSKQQAENADFDSQPESDDLQDASGSAPNLCKMRPKDYHREIQIQVCKQLGRLTNLRELTLEGQREVRFKDHEWGCLELTVETGLDQLEPLQQSLEKLVIYRLDEKLCNVKELNWIAHHWIHHNNPRWLRAQNSQKTSGVLEIHDEVPGVAQDFFVPSPTFKELVGLSVRGPHLSALQGSLLLAWLDEECPSLIIRKDDRRRDDDFSYGRFQDF